MVTLTASVKGTGTVPGRVPLRPKGTEFPASHFFLWDHLGYILAIAGEKSVAGEAKQLKVHHTTLFRRLNALEENLGVRLFERLAKGYVLTLSGEKSIKLH